MAKKKEDDTPNITKIDDHNIHSILTTDKNIWCVWNYCESNEKRDDIASLRTILNLPWNQIIVSFAPNNGSISTSYLRKIILKHKNIFLKNYIQDEFNPLSNKFETKFNSKICEEGITLLQNQFKINEHTIVSVIDEENINTAAQNDEEIMRQVSLIETQYENQPSSSIIQSEVGKRKASEVTSKLKTYQEYLNLNPNLFLITDQLHFKK